MSEAGPDDFAQLHDQAVARLSPGGRATLERLKALEPARSGRRGFEDLGGSTVRALTAAAAASERVEISRALIAWLARDVVARTEACKVTPRILERTRNWRGPLHDFLSGELPEDYAFPSDFFVKDYRFVTALSVPCGAQVTDLDDGIGPKTALLLARQLGIGAAVSAYRARWFRVHTESRYLDEFNEPGWTECYREVADLLKLHPHIRGMAATSWFYDPQLSAISPRLAYLPDLPMQYGARRVAHGTTEFDIKSATATSPTRRELYEQGKYTPVCHSILWDRDDMIRWADLGAESAHVSQSSA